MDDKSPSTGNAGKPSKPVIRGKGKGKSLNVIAAASGRDPAAIVKSVSEAEAAAKAAKVAKAAAAARAQAEKEAAENLEKAAHAHAEAQSRAKAKAKEREVAPATTQVYDSLSPQKQYRFECFRRCGFASKPMEKFVAETLIDEAEKRYLARRGAVVGLGGKLNGGVASVYDDSPSNNNIAAAVTDASDADSSSKKPNASRKRKKQSKNHVLREESKRRRAAMDQPLPYFGGGGGSGNGTVGNRSTGAPEQTPPLENLVVPNSASEIVAVVSTLAKCYAQRLVAAAKRVADAEEEERKMDGTAAGASPTTQNPIVPRHFLEAHRHRARAGIDPGFWMADRSEDGEKGSAFKKGGVGSAKAAALGTVDRDRICHLAALAAQDAFDREVEKEEEENRQGEDDKMEVEDSKAEAETITATSVQ